MTLTLIDSLILAGQKAPSADNLQPWCFRSNENQVAVVYDNERLGRISLGPDNPATLISMGGVLENMLKAADFIGAKVDWRLGEDAQLEHGNPYFTLALEHGIDHLDPATNLYEHPLFGRHTNRFPYRKDNVPKEITSCVNNLIEGTASIKLLYTPGEIRAIGSVARQASEIRFQTREVHEWLAQSLRYSKQEVARGDGIDIATFPLPPGGPLFIRFIMNWKWMERLNHLGAYKLMASIDVKLLEQAPEIIALIGGSTREDMIAAGRLLTRVWVELNAKGIAVHPYYVISDQLQRRLSGKVPPQFLSRVEAIAEQTETLLNLHAGQRLHMLLRIGYPTREPVRSQRLSNIGH